MDSDPTGLELDSIMQGWETASTGWGSDQAFPEILSKYYMLSPEWNGPHFITKQVETQM